MLIVLAAGVGARRRARCGSAAARALGAVAFFLVDPRRRRAARRRRCSARRRRTSRSTSSRRCSSRRVALRRRPRRGRSRFGAVAGAADRHRRPRGRVGLVARLDAAAVAVGAACPRARSSALVAGVAGGAARRAASAPRLRGRPLAPRRGRARRRARRVVVVAALIAYGLDTPAAAGRDARTVALTDVPAGGRAATVNADVRARPAATRPTTPSG